MKNNILIIVMYLSFIPMIDAQKEIRNFIFGHSLINHEFQVNPTPSQETSVPHWMHFLAEESGHNYTVSGQYGFLPQHANLPPFAQWGFDIVEGAWESDYEPFSDADFTHIMITPGNFIQWQGPDQLYPTDSTTPIAATSSVFQWCREQEDDLQFYIYENWPDMAPYLSNGFPPTQAEWNNYNDYLQGDFNNWYLEYHDAIIESFPDACISMIPVGPIISDLLQQFPYDQIPVSELYEDDAPHGRPTIYFLASLISYMTMYDEKAPSTFTVDPIIHPIIADNYNAVVDHIWNSLLNFNDSAGANRSFCNSISTSTTFLDDNDIEISIFPNPSSESIVINSQVKTHYINIISKEGIVIASNDINQNENNQIDIKNLPRGHYFIMGMHNENLNIVLYCERLVKL